jgi:hypothetical protein
MFHIASQTVGAGGAASITFDNIPKAYTHLQVRVFGRGTTNFSGGLSLYVSIIGNTISANRRHWLDGNGSSVLSNSDTGAGISATIADAGATANVFSNVILDILDWSNASKNLTLRSIGGYDSNGAGHAVLASGLYVPSGGTITGFIFNTDGNWVQGSRFDLYGLTTSQATGA